MTKINMNTNNKNDPQKKHGLGKVGKKITESGPFCLKTVKLA